MYASKMLHQLRFLATRSTTRVAARSLASKPHQGVWTELPPNERAAWEVLGWKEESWSGSQELPPASSLLSWDKLDNGQQAAVQHGLGLSQREWDDKFHATTVVPPRGIFAGAISNVGKLEDLDPQWGLHACTWMLHSGFTPGELTPREMGAFLNASNSKADDDAWKKFHEPYAPHLEQLDLLRPKEIHQEFLRETVQVEADEDREKINLAMKLMSPTGYAQYGLVTHFPDALRTYIEMGGTPTEDLPDDSPVRAIASYFENQVPTNIEFQYAMPSPSEAMWMFESAIHNGDLHACSKTAYVAAHHVQQIILDEMTEAGEPEDCERKKKPPIHILDLGCGPGNFGGHLATRWKEDTAGRLPPIEVVGLDVSTMALTYLQERLPMDGGPRATIYKELAQVSDFRIPPLHSRSSLSPPPHTSCFLLPREWRSSTSWPIARPSSIPSRPRPLTWWCPTTFYYRTPSWASLASRAST